MLPCTMAGAWITDAGNSGTVQITNREDDWYVIEPSTEGETKCILKGDLEIPATQSKAEIEIWVEKFVSSHGKGPNYLFAAPDDTSDEIVFTETNAGTGDSTSCTESGSSQQCAVTDLSGSGEYVTVEAVVDEIFWVKKEEPNTPDIAGALRDEESNKRRMFVVSDGVKHPYLEEGRKFVFQGAKDHYYENRDKVQLLITQYTDFTDKGVTSESITSSGQTQSSTDKSANNPSSDQNRSSATPSTSSSSSADESLHQIAKSMLADEEFTLKQQKESSIGKAKKKAKRQQRDPAIDPKLRKD